MSGNCCNGPSNSGGCKATDGRCSATRSDNEENNKTTITEEDSKMCLAIVREGGAELDVLDVRGRARTFAVGGKSSSGGRATTDLNLCFSTHGCGGGVDGLLTPCFDENGEHGEPEESCFCGVDTPHLHAHHHDPDRCGGRNGGYAKKDSRSSSSSGKEADLSFLAQVTLHPKHVDDMPEDDVTVPLVQVPVCDSLPKQCNSKDVNRQLSEYWSDRADQSSIKQRRKTYKVQHDDHFDNLVHDLSSGFLRLEHNCNDCGDTDLHGKLDLVEKREWLGESDLATERSLHFFEVSNKPFHLLDIIREFFETDSDRVHAIREMCRCCSHDSHRRPSLGGKQPSFKTEVLPSKKCCSNCSSSVCPADCCGQKSVPLLSDSCSDPISAGTSVVRSEFHAKKICCASEIPAINAIVEPLPGVSKVMVNTTIRAVYVDHDPSQTTATDIQDALNAERFGASVKKDGGEAVVTSKQGPQIDRSQFLVEKICCSSEIPVINSIVEPIPGVRKVAINVTNKIVYVDHDPAVTSATEIARALNDEHFGAHVQKDAGHKLATLSGLPASFVESTFTINGLGTGEVTEEDVSAAVASLGDGRVRGLDIYVPSKTVKLHHKPALVSAQTIVEALSDKGIESIVLVDGAADGTFALSVLNDETDESIEKHRSHVNPFVLLSGIFWIVSMLSFIGGNWEYLKYAGLISVAFGIPPIAMKTFYTLRRYRFDANCMMFLAAVGAVALQEFQEAAAVTFLFSISEWLENRATARARNALSAIVSLRPDRANIINSVTKEVVVVPASRVAVGALVSVRTGDKIPTDGIVIEGRSTVDESSLTGESRPVCKGLGDAVSGGTINSGTMQLVVRTTSTVDNSAVARLIRLVEEAQANRSPTEKLVDEFAKRYTPLVLLVAVGMCTIPWALGSDVGKVWTMNGLVTIVIACPCALIISTPVTYVAGLAASAQRGIVVKGGAHLEALGLVKKIAFDKTGTLTEGNFALLHLVAIDGRRTRKEVLEYLALIEGRASHPLAAALVFAAKNEGIIAPKHVTLEDHTILKGEGVSATVDGAVVHVGNHLLFERLGLLSELPKTDKALADDWAASGGTVGFMSIEGEGIVGAYCVADAVREESASVVNYLHRLGIELVMLTGDGRDAALAIGAQVGLSPSEVCSSLLPEDKLKLISAMKEGGTSNNSALYNLCTRRRHVLMCGDGVNDAPAMAMADVGVAMGAGAALALETSDVTLMDSNLLKLLYSIKMGRRVIRTIKENVFFSLAVKAVVMGFTFAGKTTLWAAIGSDVGAMLIVTLNGMKLLPSKKSDFALEDSAPGTNKDIEERNTSVVEGGDFFKNELCCT